MFYERERERERERFLQTHHPRNTSAWMFYERERERFLQTHHPRSSSFEYRSSLLPCGTYVKAELYFR
jgi:hypothetical protein